jgi:glycosyltransferase involved in cell wall biosynthesis
MLPSLPHLGPSPLISAIIPAYNAARFLPAAVASIRAQNYSDLEIIVVDDGSSDDTAEVVAALGGVRYLRQDNRGPAAARNSGIRAARGEVLGFLDADDLWLPNLVSALLPPLVADAQLRYCWGHTQWVRYAEQDGAFCKQHVEHADYPLCLIPAALFRRAAFDEVGLFNEGLLMAEDTDWLAAARFQQLPQRQMPVPVLVYRRHAGSLTAARPVPKQFVLSMLKQSLHRHRATPVVGKAA